MAGNQEGRPFVLGLLILFLLVGCSAWAANPVANMYNHQLDLVENDVLSLARAMPADKYDFAPTGGGFAGVRTFGEQIRHLATMIYMTAAIVLEERPPYGPGANNNGPDGVRSKDEVIRYLEGAFAYARGAMDSLSEKNQLDPIPTFFGAMPRVAVAAGVVYHSYNHYGQMVVYARMNGLAPPTSVPSSTSPAP
jgi:hypothetical protein